MKNQIVFLVGLILITNHLYSQSDKQWLIWNSLGKSGYSGGVNVFSNNISNQFTLSEIASPNVSSIPNARNDLFIIYADGEHFNTRTPSGQGFFYNPPDYGNNIKDHYFDKAAPGGVKYLYLTNRYEGDDLPPNVKARAGQYGSPSKTYPITTTDGDWLSASHEVVYNRDITVIINYDSLRAFDSKEDPQSDTYILQFDGVQTIYNPPIPNSPVAYGNNFLDLRPVFGNIIGGPQSAIYPGPTPSPGPGEQVTLNPGTDHYGYINLRKTSTAFPPLPSGQARYNAIFTLKKNGDFVRAWAEPMRASHDPNFLKVESICQASNGSYFVVYHLQFENTSTIPAESLVATVNFPPQFDLSCLRAFDWYAAGGWGGTLDVSGNICKFNFNANASIFHHATNATQGIGSVNFKVMVQPGYDLSNLNNSLRLNTPLVSFDGIEFPIEDFQDLVFCKQDGVPDAASQDASKKPEELKKQEKSEKEEKPEKGEKSEKKEKQEGSSKSLGSGSNDMGHLIDSLPPIGPPYFCSRPITTTNCSCGGIICWACVWAGAAVLLAIASIFIYRGWRRRNPRPPLGK